MPAMGDPRAIKSWARSAQIVAGDYSRALGESPERYALRRELDAAQAVMARLAEEAEREIAHSQVVSLAGERRRRRPA